MHAAPVSPCVAVVPGMSLSLTPFGNQVGGHVPLFRLRENNTLCKPLVQSELDFYHFVAHECRLLTAFIAQCLYADNKLLFDDNHILRRALSPSPTHMDTLDYVSERMSGLHDDDDDDDDDDTVPSLPERDIFHMSDLEDDPPEQTVSRTSRRPRSNPEYATVADTFADHAPPSIVSHVEARISRRVPLERPPGALSLDSPDLKGDSGGDLASSTLTHDQHQSPWSQKCLSGHRFSQYPSSSPSRPSKFLLLQDLTRGMSRPCILDLKMGTRMYSVYASPRKVHSQTQKAENTTSASLGVRICGMQYEGRKVSDWNGFVEMLSRYIRGGSAGKQAPSRGNLDLPRLVQRLQELEAAVQSYPSIRLYSSSLLLVYDAASLTFRERGGGLVNVHVWMIDFANAVGWKDPREVSGTPFPPESMEGPDMGYLKGLESLVKAFRVLN
ncbi:MAG: hypothetical protein SGCHY_001341 [Lobulomycetales sp.]